MDLVAFAEKQLGQVRAVLSCDAGDECSLHVNAPEGVNGWTDVAYSGRAIGPNRRTAATEPWSCSWTCTSPGSTTPVPGLSRWGPMTSRSGPSGTSRARRG